MNKLKIHPLILLGVGISSAIIGMRAYGNFSADNAGYGVALSVLGIFFAILAIYGWMRNQKIDRVNRRIKKGQKLIR
ncbi:hypothetical protein [Planomicrobium sp. CPCC 101110]|uniref:hypothetical protein n=1 Tax=Planomicrobium sp. CPCC 101110 TaxID=2599619 RepID=UPI0011B473E6|nr:hypothetical protein [Planomicrobium sp. CPCC 101110]TWT25098.1 hypothetical protein FQV30_12035 [Planomicrobium sp. CPCC 101110]